MPTGGYAHVCRATPCPNDAGGVARIGARKRCQTREGDVVELTSLGVSVPLAALYRRTDVPETPFENR